MLAVGVGGGADAGDEGGCAGGTGGHLVQGPAELGMVGHVAQVGRGGLEQRQAALGEQGAGVGGRRNVGQLEQVVEDGGGPRGGGQQPVVGGARVAELGDRKSVV